MYCPKLKRNPEATQNLWQWEERTDRGGIAHSSCWISNILWGCDIILDTLFRRKTIVRVWASGTSAFAIGRGHFLICSWRKPQAGLAWEALIMVCFSWAQLFVTPPPPQWANLGLQVVELSYNCYFLHILIPQSKNVATIMTEHQKENLFVLTALFCMAGFWAGTKAHFWLKILLFCATPT